MEDERTVQVADRVVETGEAVRHLAQVGQNERLDVTRTVLPGDRQGTVVVPGGGVQAAQLLVDDRQVAQVGGLPAEPAEPLVDGEGLVEEGDREFRPTGLDVDGAEVAQDARLPVEPVGAPGEVQRGPVVLDRLKIRGFGVRVPGGAPV